MSDPETLPILYVTKHALTRGIVEVYGAEDCGDGMIRWMDYAHHAHGEGRKWSSVFIGKASDECRE